MVLPVSQSWKIARCRTGVESRAGVDSGIGASSGRNGNRGILSSALNEGGQVREREEGSGEALSGRSSIHTDTAVPSHILDPSVNRNLHAVATVMARERVSAGGLSVQCIKKRCHGRVLDRPVLRTRDADVHRFASLWMGSIAENP